MDELVKLLYQKVPEFSRVSSHEYDDLKYNVYGDFGLFLSLLIDYNLKKRNELSSSFDLDGSLIDDINRENAIESGFNYINYLCDKHQDEEILNVIQTSVFDIMINNIDNNENIIKNLRGTAVDIFNEYVKLNE